MKIIGIDFGTVSLRVAVMIAGKPELIEMGNGKTYIPSAIVFDNWGKCYIGEAAEEILLENPSAGIRNIKQFIGKQSSFNMAGATLSIYQIIAIFFREIKRQAEKYLGETINEAIVTVPESFDYFQRQIIIDSGQIAGLKIKRIMNDSSALALSYTYYYRSDSQIVVCDCGEKFCNFSFVILGDGVSDVWLSKTVEMDYEQIGNEYTIKTDLRGSLSEFINNCKKERVYELDENKLSIYMSGGLAKNYQIMEILQENHLIPIYDIWNKDFVVKGATLTGGKLKGDASCGDLLYLEYWTNNLFLETNEGVKETLIEDNTTIPIKKNISIECGQSTSIHLYQEALDRTKRVLAIYDVLGINEKNKTVDLVVSIDAYSHLLMDVDSSAKEKGIRITKTYGVNLSESEIGKQKSLLKIILANIVKKNNKKTENNLSIDYSSEEAVKEVLIKLLPVLDNLEKGISSIPPNELNTSLGQGFELIYKQMKNALKDLEIEEIGALGRQFNPKIHNAIACEYKVGVKKGIVTEVYEKGYMYKGKVLRFSKVKVNN